MINQLTIKFESIRQLCTLFKCLSPTYLVASSNKDILEDSEVLQSEYLSDILVLDLHYFNLKFVSMININKRNCFYNPNC